MAEIEYWFAGSHEEFPPSDLIAQGCAADTAGFDGIGCSDHFHPWFPGGQSGSAWVWLGAMGQLCERPIGTGVTPVIHRYHPGVIAQAFMSLEELYPGRAFLGVGSGEALNEVPLGLDWPDSGEMLRRFETGLEAIERLWAGETVTMDGGWFSLREAQLYTRAPQRPRLYVSAFGPQAARIAGRHGDGLWTLGDPEQAPEVIDAYLASCQEHDRRPGKIILQAGFAWASDEQAAIDGARHWKTTQIPEFYNSDAHDLEAMLAHADERMTDEQFAKEGFIVGADPQEHVERIREIAAIEHATTVCLQLIGTADPLGSIETYRETVLPALRG